MAVVMVVVGRPSVEGVSIQAQTLTSSASPSGDHFLNLHSILRRKQIQIGRQLKTISRSNC